MTDEPDLKILAPRSSLPKITRRAFMAGMGVTAAAGGSIILSACGSGNSPSSSQSPGAASSGPIEGQLNFFNWAAYDAPSLFKKFTTETGAKTQIDVFDSNEQAIAKLNAAQGTSNYDIVVPTGVYIPLMVQQQLIQPIDTTRLKNFKNIDSAYLNQKWDPGNKYSVPKDWGTTGYMFDTTVVKRKMETWQDFIDAMQNEAKNNTSVLATPGNLTSLYFWTQNPVVDWTTTDPTQLKKCETFIMSEVAPYVKAYDSYPAITMTQGKYALSMAWSGDARAGMIRGKNTGNIKYVLPKPTSELWMDNWVLVKNAPHPNAAYAWIDFILEPANSLIDLQYHGYNTAIKGMQQIADKAGLPLTWIIFPTPQQVASLVPGAVNSALDTLNNIFQQAQAVSAGG